jgi:hypothetical protein
MKLRSGKIINNTYTKNLNTIKSLDNYKQNDNNSKREIFTFSIIFTSILLLGNIFDFESVLTDFFKNHKFSLFSDL